MKALHIIPLLLALVACSAPRGLESDHTTTHVTVWTESYPMEVSVTFPEIRQQVAVKDSSSHLENRYARSDASVDRWGFLHHSLETIPQEITSEVEVQTVYRDSIVYRDREVVLEVEVPAKLTIWQRFWIRAGKALSGLVVLLVIYLALKFALKR